jgi:Zn-dependent protease
MVIEYFFVIFILLYSIIFHEIAHGYAAYKLGDPTAKYEGRLTLNPLAHIDPIGTIVVPALSFLIGGFLFGWAKPVPYNPFNLKNQSRDSLLIALAGPLTNIFLCLFFVFLYKIFPLDIFYFGLRINLILSFFNLLPIPPLDGSKILLAKLSIEQYQYLESFGFILLIIFLSFFFNYFSNFINLLMRFLVGS